MTESALKSLQTRHGPMLGFRGDRFITACLEAYGEFSFAEWQLLEQMVKPGGVVVEAGANIGLHTVPLARRCAPAALHAFEPQQRVFQALCANLALNDIGNVVALPEACGAEPGWARVPEVDYLRAANVGGTALAADDDAAGQRVRVTPIDSLGLAECALMKIDVEGFETQALLGARETIARCRPRIYIENDRREHQQELISLLDDLGYRMHWHLPPMVDDAVQPNIFGRRVVSVNMVCLPKESRTVIDLPAIDPAHWSHPLGPRGA